MKSNSLPYSSNSELLKYKKINEDIETIKLYLLLVFNGKEKPEQNIEKGVDNKTFIINSVSDYHQG